MGFWHGSLFDKSFSSPVVFFEHHLATKCTISTQAISDHDSVSKGRLRYECQTSIHSVIEISLPDVHAEQCKHTPSSSPKRSGINDNLSSCLSICRSALADGAVKLGYGVLQNNDFTTTWQ
jgi:hypothetical protein